MKRRSFLKLFNYSAVAGLTGYIGASVISNSCRYYKHFGLSLPIPDNWFSYTLQDIVELQGKQKYSQEQYNGDDAYTIWPLLVYSKYKEPTTRMNPSIVVFGCEMPGWCHDFSLTEMASSLEDDYSHLVDNHWFVEVTKLVWLGGKQSARTVVAYLHEENTGFTQQLLRTSYLFKNETFLFLVFLSQSYSGSERADEVFTRFIDEFKLS